jgi:hypothetical protein
MTTKPASDNSWTEPESEASVENPPVYPFNRATVTTSGHSFEMDDTKNRERIRIQHGGAKTGGVGTFFEMQSNGDLVTKVIGDNYEIVAGKNNVLIKGVCNITIDGDSIVHVKGDKYERIDGNLIQEVRGNYTQTVVGNSVRQSYEDMSFNCGNPADALPAGSIYFNLPDEVYISGDLNVAGSAYADIISALTKVQAGTQVTAGPLGFVSELGGLAIGFPVATPLSATVATNITAGVSVKAPLIQGIMVKDVLSTMMTMRTQYNTHIHKSPKGPTSTPLRKML